MKTSLIILTATAMLSFSALGQQVTSTATRGNTDIVVGVPPSVVWGPPREPENNCMRCCVYENRNYTEGAVVRTEGVLLQCVRDQQTIGTNTLIWRVLKQ